MLSLVLLALLQNSEQSGAKVKQLPPDEKVKILKLAVAVLQLQQQLQAAAVEYQKAARIALEKTGQAHCELTALAEVVCQAENKP